MEELIVLTKNRIESVIKSINKIMTNNVKIIQNNDNEKIILFFQKKDVQQFLNNNKKFF